MRKFAYAAVFATAISAPALAGALMDHSVVSVLGAPDGGCSQNAPLAALTPTIPGMHKAVILKHLAVNSASFRRRAPLRSRTTRNQGATRTSRRAGRSGRALPAATSTRSHHRRDVAPEPSATRAVDQRPLDGGRWAVPVYAALIAPSLARREWTRRPFPCVHRAVRRPPHRVGPARRAGRQPSTVTVMPVIVSAARVGDEIGQRVGQFTVMARGDAVAQAVEGRRRQCASGERPASVRAPAGP